MALEASAARTRAYRTHFASPVGIILFVVEEPKTGGDGKQNRAHQEFSVRTYDEPLACRHGSACRTRALHCRLPSLHPAHTPANPHGHLPVSFPLPLPYPPCLNSRYSRPTDPPPDASLRSSESFSCCQNDVQGPVRPPEDAGDRFRGGSPLTFRCFRPRMRQPRRVWSERWSLNRASPMGAPRDPKEWAA